MIRSFRLQITAWYLLFFALLFVGFGVFLYGVLARALVNRLDEMLGAQADTAVALFQSEMQELGGNVEAAAPETASEMRTHGVLIGIREGRRVLASSEPAGVALFEARALPPGVQSAVRRVGIGGRTYEVMVLAPMDSVSNELRVVRRVLYFALPLLLLVAGAGGFLLAGRSLRPLERMKEQARRITGESLHTRLAIGRSPEELAVLADTFNELLARLDASFETMRRFVADASHELRTPLAVIRGEADVALANDRPAGEYRTSLAVVQDEAKRLSRLVDDLLKLARADAGHVKLQAAEFYLNDLLDECCRSVEALAAAKQIAVECYAEGDTPFHGDEELLRRLVFNLVDNAIRYTPSGGRVSVRLDDAGAALRIVVADTGVGIPAETLPHIFERFYRGDGARSRNEGGFGLGLAIVQWIAEAHRGSVKVDSGPGAGSVFTVALPK
jgi:heavy metal sensor kinase